jgi:hypothetical protein
MDEVKDGTSSIAWYIGFLALAEKHHSLLYKVQFIRRCGH